MDKMINKVMYNIAKRCFIAGYKNGVEYEKELIERQLKALKNQYFNKGIKVGELGAKEEAQAVGFNFGKEETKSYIKKLILDNLSVEEILIRIEQL